MRGRRESRPALVLAAVGAVVVAALPAGAGAGASGQATFLRGEQSSLAARSRAALLGLYSLDTQLARARAQLASVRARAAEVERERERVAHEIAVARGVLLESQRQLAARLRTLYEEGEPDAIAVLLGATSLADAVSRLDELERSAHLNRQAIDQSSAARERERVAHEIAVARNVLLESQRQLAARLRTLYEEGEPDAIAVLLGATSLEDAVSRLDELERSAHLNRQAIDQSSGARERLSALAAKLAGRAAELRRLEASAARTAASLAAARAERIRYIASLRHEQRLKAAQIARLDATARTSARRTQTIAADQSVAAVAAATAASPAVAGAGDGTLTVTSTGYSLAGTTATGLPVGWGIVAVDPSLIPLGTRMTIPGYGEGVAADTGSSVQGATIDLWFPTTAQALAWGRRVVTITLH